MQSNMQLEARILIFLEKYYALLIKRSDLRSRQVILILKHLQNYRVRHLYVVNQSTLRYDNSSMNNIWRHKRSKSIFVISRVYMYTQQYGLACRILVIKGGHNRVGVVADVAISLYCSMLFFCMLKHSAYTLHIIFVHICHDLYTTRKDFFNNNNSFFP